MICQNRATPFEVTEQAVGQKNNPALEMSAPSNISLDKSPRNLLPQAREA